MDTETTLNPFVNNGLPIAFGIKQGLEKSRLSFDNLSVFPTLIFVKTRAGNPSYTNVPLKECTLDYFNEVQDLKLMTRSQGNTPSGFYLETDQIKNLLCPDWDAVGVVDRESVGELSPEI